MAWTDQCKIAFKTNADARKFKKKGGGITKILKDLSKESGIPFKTLNRWYYEKDYLKNEVSDTTAPNNNDNSPDTSPDSPDIPLCHNCKKSPVELSKKTGKPAGPPSKYYGLCGMCRKRAKAMTDLIECATTENGELVICPNCDHQFYIPKGDQ